MAAPVVTLAIVKDRSGKSVKIMPLASGHEEVVRTHFKDRGYNVSIVTRTIVR